MAQSRPRILGRVADGVTWFAPGRHLRPGVQLGRTPLLGGPVDGVACSSKISRAERHRIDGDGFSTRRHLPRCGAGPPGTPGLRQQTRTEHIGEAEDVLVDAVVVGDVGGAAVILIGAVVARHQQLQRVGQQKRRVRSKSVGITVVAVRPGEILVEGVAIDPLIGVGLLAGFEFRMQTVSGGTVSILPMA